MCISLSLTIPSLYLSLSLESWREEERERERERGGGGGEEERNYRIEKPCYTLRYNKSGRRNQFLFYSTGVIKRHTDRVGVGVVSF